MRREQQSEKRFCRKNILFDCFGERTKIFIIQTLKFVTLITVKIKTKKVNKKKNDIKGKLECSEKHVF